MLLSWVAPYSSGVIEIVIYCLGFDLLRVCLTWIPEPLFFWMVVDPSGNPGLSVLARHRCSNVGFLDCNDDLINDFAGP